MLLIDAHVHIYDCFELEYFFDSAFANFKSEAKKLGHGNNFTGILLLAETSKDCWFQRLKDSAKGKDLPDGKDLGCWQIRHTSEHYSIIAESKDFKKLILIAGRQVVTAEKLEVLSLCNSETFEEGKPISSLIRGIEEKGAIAVIPWGVGKWFGNRGKVVKNIINNNTSSIYLGDNRNRPGFWHQPALFRSAEQNGIGILPGSDPLPFTSESFRAGSYGFSANLKIDPKRPGEAIRQLLRNTADSIGNRFGRLENNFKFFLNQFRMQIVKRNLK